MCNKKALNNPRYPWMYHLLAELEKNLLYNCFVGCKSYHFETRIPKSWRVTMKNKRPVAWTVVIKPSMMPKFSCTTWTQPALPLASDTKGNLGPTWSCDHGDVAVWPWNPWFETVPLWNEIIASMKSMCLKNLEPANLVVFELKLEKLIASS